MEILHDDLKMAVERLFHATVGDPNTLGNSANAMFEVSIADRPVILRVSPYSEEKEAHVAFELAWMEHLSNAMSHIAYPVPSLNGLLYEIVDGYILCVFEKAAGRSVDPMNTLEWNENLFRNMGEVMGELHRNTQKYVAQNGVSTRFDWQHNFLFWPEHNRFSDPDVEPAWDAVLAEMSQLPRTTDVYGIIHNDIHHLNFHVMNDDITLFDFDDCEYGWYAHDIASTCFFITGTAGLDDEVHRQSAAENFLVPFLRGYLSRFDLPCECLKWFDLFLRYRMLGQYKFVVNMMHGVPASENPHIALIDWLKDRIISNQGFVTIDYDKIAEQIYR